MSKQQTAPSIFTRKMKGFTCAIKKGEVSDFALVLIIRLPNSSTSSFKVLSSKVSMII